MATTQEFCTPQDASEARRVGKRLEEVAWALFLIMTGALWLAPDAWVPEGSWLIGVGLILLGLNVARHLCGLKMNGFGIVVGLAALAAGVGHILGRELPIIPIFLILLGAAIVIKAVAGTRKQDGAVRAS